jgi:hypothetical protein
MRSSRPSKRQAVPVKRDHYREVARALLDGVCVPALGDGEGNGRMPQVNDRTAPAAAPAWAALTDGVNGREVDDRLTPVVLRRAATPVALLSDQCVEDVDLLVPSREVRVRTRRTPSAWAAATATAGGNQMAKVVTARRFPPAPCASPPQTSRRRCYALRCPWLPASSQSDGAARASRRQYGSGFRRADGRPGTPSANGNPGNRRRHTSCRGLR